MRRRSFTLHVAGAALLGTTLATPALAAGLPLPHMTIDATQSRIVRVDYRGGRRYHHRRYPVYVFPVPRAYDPPPVVIYYPPPVAYYPPAVIYNRYAPPVSYYGYYPSYAPYGYGRRYYADW